MRMRIKSQLAGLAMLTAVFFMAQGATAQTKPGFSGEWSINQGKSEGAEASPPILFIDRKNDTLSVKRIEVDERTFVEKICFDGKKFVSVTGSGRPKTGTAKWNEKERSFTENAVLGEQGNAEKIAFKVIEKWSLSADGKELTVETTISNASGASATTKAVYDRN